MTKTSSPTAATMSVITSSINVRTSRLVKRTPVSALFQVASRSVARPRNASTVAALRMRCSNARTWTSAAFHRRSYSSANKRFSGSTDSKCFRAFGFLARRLQIPPGHLSLPWVHLEHHSLLHRQHPQPHLPLLQVQPLRKRPRRLGRRQPTLHLRRRLRPVLTPDHPAAHPGPAAKREQRRGTRRLTRKYLYNSVSVSRDAVFTR